jgi:dynein heavy chain
VTTVDNNICQSSFRILDCYFSNYIESEMKKVNKDDIATLESMIPQLFVFSFIWSIGTTTTIEGRIRFDKFFREKIQKIGIEFPEEKLVYDYMFMPDTKEWKYWMETVPEYQVDIKNSYNEIVVPTVDSIRMKFFMKMLVMNGKHCLAPGPTGVGKSVYI